MTKKELVPVEFVGAPSRGGRPPIRLDTARGCIEELASVYREAKRGRLDMKKATSLAYLLQIMIKGHELVALESRIAALEIEHGPQS
ncbi:hypothetical protein [Ferrovum sp.]|uniref:hypothetical protein n=1 Tax=Ferrovum sp. TaxID=2609467 RepID=UPI002630A1EB|nr:hypothetical protein [Ferrovum sp.]